MEPTLSRRTALAALATTALLPATALSPATASARDRVRLRLPAPSGPYAVGTTSTHLVDRSRADPYVTDQPYRELMATVTYPARGGGPPAPWLTPGWVEHAETVMQGLMGDLPPGLVDWAGARSYSRFDAHPLPGPVVLVTLGHWFSLGAVRTVMEDLASHGYVVVATDPTYETPVRFPDRLVPVHDAALPPPGAEVTSPAFFAYVRTIYRSRVADARFALDALGAAPGLPEPLRRSLRTGPVGVVGGGTGAGLAALQLAHDDPRVAAAAVGDSAVGWPTPDGTAPITTVVEDGLDGPVLAVLPGAVDRDPLWDRQWTGLRGWRRELEVREGGHAWLTDLQTVLPQVVRGLDLPTDHFAPALGTADPASVLAARRTYLRAFFDLHLRGRDHHLLDAPSPRHRVVRFVR
ncbi:hypothetical protein ABZ816_04565 [Actinosynnema sp. NPDC047251]|uniref:Uncharacterized protein n=1 Tax=Saccharothrix espanaensis (strain ATCC 51144 / DSM 44229 / JCM 9112 / NBRC 15066 / NRRL 15764) TaxID=1179773 RepID=K0K1U7_SACES|nr:hypothetical protein [Saccharothrix espanaensis]CCH31537.1 hypothetical protein BN6_42520 [Saccharothrix espanaensis DSM 44229]